MRRTVLTLVLSLIAGLAFASTAAAVTASGTVSVPAGWSQQNICVTSYAAGFPTAIGHALTAADGTYTVDISGTATVDLVFDAVEGICDTTQYTWQPLRSTLLGQAVSGDLANVDVTMALVGNSISGRVNVPGGYTAGDICVTAYARNGDGSNGDYADSTTTRTTGVWAMLVNNGAYNVLIDAGNFCTDQNLMERGFDNVVVDGITPAAVGTATLTEGARVSGTITTPSGISNANLCVSVFDASNDLAAEVVTNGSGVYLAQRLYPGQHSVMVSGYCNGQGRVANLIATQSAPLTLTAGTTVMQNLSPPRGGSITGTITVPGGYSTAGICVYAYASTSTGPTDWYANAVADASGGYSVEGLTTDTYTLRVVPGQYCSDSDLLEQNGRQVAVTVGSDSSGINFALAKPAPSPVTTPAPSGAAPTTKTPSVNLAVAKPVVAGSTITTTFTASGPGTATQSGVVASGKRLARAGVTVCSVRAKVKKAGKVKLVCVLNAAGKRLRKQGALKVVLTTVFSPSKGTKATSTRMITIPKR
jgi:hypothetical protein